MTRPPRRPSPGAAHGSEDHERQVLILLPGVARVAQRDGIPRRRIPDLVRAAALDPAFDTAETGELGALVEDAAAVLEASGIETGLEIAADQLEVEDAEAALRIAIRAAFLGQDTDDEDVARLAAIASVLGLDETTFDRLCDRAARDMPRH